MWPTVNSPMVKFKKKEDETKFVPFKNGIQWSVNTSRRRKTPSRLNIRNKRGDYMAIKEEEEE